MVSLASLAPGPPQVNRQVTGKRHNDVRANISVTIAETLKTSLGSAVIAK
jgi:hypothetical protein